MQHSAKEISKMLAERAESICRLLLPDGKKDGSEWRCADLSGTKGTSLGVHLTGPKAGIWCDFANNEDKGDLLDLWVATKGIPFRQAYLEAKKFLGINGEPVQGFNRNYKHPDKTGCKPVTPEQKVWNYLTKDRMLLKETLATYRVGEKDGHIVFQFISPTGELQNLKHLDLERTNGKKNIRLESGCAMPLYGWQSIPHGARSVIICEGEIDAMTWFQWGHPALSVPNGCTAKEWIDLEWDNLAPFDTIYLSYDMDDEGRAGVVEIAKRLGLHRCALLELPFKDANECLQKGFTSWDANGVIEKARWIIPPEICEPNFFAAKVDDYFRCSGGQSNGFAPSFGGGKLRFRPGEVTILTGTSGHGKSTLWSQILVEAIAGKMKCAFASLEIMPAISLGIMARQWHGKDVVEKPDLDKWLDLLGGTLWLFNLYGSQPAPLILDLCRYARARYAVDIFVIDSLMKLSIDSDDYNQQREFLNLLTKFTIETGAHVILVAHPRKGKDEESEPGKLDIKGSSDIFNQADNVMILWRNKRKEKQKEKGQFDKTEPDAKLYVDKQRLTGIEFCDKLWFLPHAKQFKHHADASASNFHVSEIPKSIPELNRQ